MKQYCTLSSKTGKILFGSFLCVLLFMNRDTMYSMAVLGFYPAQFISLGAIGAAVLTFLVVCRKDIGKLLLDRRIPLLGIFTVIYVLPMLIKRDWQIMYFSVLMCLYVAVFLTLFTTGRETAGYFVKIMAVLAVHSLLATYLFRIPADRGFLVPPVAVNTSELPFYNYVLSFVSLDFVKNRNFGLFREPGVYQYFLMLAIYLNNYHVDWASAKQLWIVNGILGITMLSTFATGGVIALGLFVVVLYLEKQWYRTRQGRILGLSAVAFVAAALAVIILQHGELYGELWMMMKKFTDGSDSMTDRVGSLVVNGKFFAHSPLWGAGIYEVLHAIENNTSSSTILLAIFGIVGGGLNIAAWFMLVWDKKRPVIWNLALTAILAMTFNTENLITDPFFWMFPIMAMTEWLLPRMDRKRV